MSEEMYRVRRISDGWYLTAIRCGHGEMNLRWWGPAPRADEMPWPLTTAGRIAAVMIALTGDHGIEIEPVEG